MPFGAVAVAVRFFLLGFYFVGGPFILPKDSDSLWFWTTWGTTCFYKVMTGAVRGMGGEAS